MSLGPEYVWELARKVRTRRFPTTITRQPVWPTFRDDQLRLRQLPDLMSQISGSYPRSVSAQPKLLRFERHKVVKLLESDQSQLALRIFRSRRHGYAAPTTNSAMSSEPPATQSSAASTRPLQPALVFLPILPRANRQHPRPNLIRHTRRPLQPQSPLSKSGTCNTCPRFQPLLEDPLNIHN